MGGIGQTKRAGVGVRIFTMHPFILFDFQTMWPYYLLQIIKAIRGKKVIRRPQSCVQAALGRRRLKQNLSGMKQYRKWIVATEK